MPNFQTLEKEYFQELEIPETSREVLRQKCMFNLNENHLFLPEYQLDTRTNNIIGYFYENLSRAIVGGEKRLQNLNSYLACEPDSSKDSTQTEYEHKGVSIRGDCKLYDEQIRRYMLVQLGKCQYKEPRIVWNIFLHDVKDIRKKTKGNLELVVQELSQRTQLMLNLPLSVILAIYSKREYTSFYIRQESGREIRHRMTRFRPNQIAEFMRNPEKSLEYFGLNKEDYELEKYILPAKLGIIGLPKSLVIARLPEIIRLERKLINPFPILIVKDKNHKEWLLKFRQEYGTPESIGRIINELAEESGVNTEEDFIHFRGSLFGKKQEAQEEKEQEAIPF